MPELHDHAHPPRAPVAISAERLERAAALLRALGDRQRLEILCELGHGERCVSELADSETNLSTVSQRLKTLRQAGLVERRRDGKHIYYRLADEHVRELIDNALAHAEHTAAPTAPLSTNPEESS
ncbi:MAG TPA: metalloregulator ArsR/SmtB family transcription factor, partial [Myxococcota bacterium]|nr:metalloregulator ArsR/SmtB family transcription factor [Myxococcota bacterium]